jgi:hypothetical protein
MALIARNLQEQCTHSALSISHRGRLIVEVFAVPEQVDAGAGPAWVCRGYAGNERQRSTDPRIRRETQRKFHVFHVSACPTLATRPYWILRERDHGVSCVELLDLASFVLLDWPVGSGPRWSTKVGGILEDNSPLRELVFYSSQSRPDA